MRVPPRWIRRVLIDPAVVLGVVLAVVSLPVAAIGAAFASRYVPGKWRIPRIVWFLFLYLLVEVASLVVLFGFWVASGFGWKISAPFWTRAHYGLFAWMLRRVVASAKVTFKVRIYREGEAPRQVGKQRRPALVMSRHAGPGDSMLLMNALCNNYRRRPLIVLKEFMQWDPALDVMLNRLPSIFVPSVKRGGEAVQEAIVRVVASMEPDDAFVIFPEGANFTERRYRIAIEKLHAMGRPDLAERAAALKNTLPPRSTGVKAALAAAPEPADVFFVGHAGLETFLSWGDIWRGMPIDTRVAVRIWHYPAELVPAPKNQEAWLYEVWTEIDRWIGERMSDTGEPFDDPDYY